MEDRPREEAAPAAEVLRAKRLEIVDDEGEIRISLETHPKGAGGLTVFDASGRRRAALEAGEAQEQGSGLSLFDTNGRARAVVYAHNDPKKGTAVYLNDENETLRAILSLSEGGHAGLSVLAGEKDRKISVAVQPDGSASLSFTGEGPMIGLGSFEEGGNKGANLILADEKGQAGIVLDGRRHKPFIRFRDPAGKVRAGLELTPGGELEVTSFGGDARSTSLGDRHLNFLWAFLFCLLIIGGAFLGVWAIGLFSGAGGVTQAGPGMLSLGASAVVISLVIAALVVLLDYFRR